MSTELLGLFFYIKAIQRMKKKGDHRPRNSAQYERVVELLIMHKAKWTPRPISLLPSVSQPRSIIRQLRKSLEIGLGVHFALCIKESFFRINIVQDVKIKQPFQKHSFLERSSFAQKRPVKPFFLNNPTIIHYFLPISHFPKQCEIIWGYFSPSLRTLQNAPFWGSFRDHLTFLTSNPCCQGLAKVFPSYSHQVLYL